MFVNDDIVVAVVSDDTVAFVCYHRHIQQYDKQQ